MIKWEDFEKVDIRVGTILTADEFPKAKKPAFKMTIDFGELGIKTSSAQITHHYNTFDLIGRQVVAVVNFPPRQIADFISECLVLGVYAADGVVLLVPDKRVDNGGRVG